MQEKELEESLWKELTLAIYSEVARLVRQTPEDSEIEFEPAQIQQLRALLERYLIDTMQIESSGVKSRLQAWATDKRWEKSVQKLLPLLVEHLFPQESINSEEL